MRKATNVKKDKQWYRDAVEGCLIVQGIPKKEAKLLIRRYGLKERLNLYTNEQLHYPIEATVKEILSM